MSIVSSFCFLIAVIILLSCARKGSDIFSPGRVFGFVWSIAIGLADLKLSRLQHEWGTFAWIALCLGIASFLTGLFAIRVITLRSPTFPIPGVRKRCQQDSISERRLFLIIVGLFVAYAVAYSIEWLHYGVLPLFAKFPDRARGEFAMFGFHLIVNTMPTILFLVLQYFLFIQRRPARKTVLAVAFLLTFISSFFLLNRLFYVLFFLLALVLAFYTTRHVRLRNALIVVPAFIAILAWVQAYREVTYVESFLHAISYMKYSSTYAAFTGPYMYIVMNLENFARAVERLDSFGYGVFSFDFLFALTGLKHWIADYFGLQERMFLISGYNTFPFLWDFYYDFGLLGLTIIPAVMGFGIGSLHAELRANPGIRIATFYSIAVFVMIISFFTNIWALLNFIVNLVALIFSQYIISSPQLRNGVRATYLPVTAARAPNAE